jgi:two-component system sensor histidine kinase QseC
LSLLLVAAIVALAFIESVWSYFGARNEVEEVFDAELAQMARLVSALIVPSEAASNPQQLREVLESALHAGVFDSTMARNAASHPYEKKIALQIWDAEGQPLLAANYPAPSERPRVGFDWLSGDAYRWRVFAFVHPDSGFSFQTAQREDIRQELVGLLAASTVVPLLVILPFLIAAVFAVVYGGFRQLRHLERRIVRLGPDQLSVQDMQHTPREVAGLVDAINGLLTRLDDALERERRFSADAAHELRTPLAALRLNLERESKLGADSRQRLMQAVDRMSHLIDQMLMLARLEGKKHALQPCIDLADLLAEAVATMTPLALNKRIEPVLDSDQQPLPMAANARLLEAMLQSLLRNAISYSPQDTVITIRLRSHHTDYEISIEDEGPGIAAELRERALAPYVRLDQRAAQGSGLGLAIATRIMALHGGRLELDDRSDGKSGLQVRLVFPTVAAP